MSFSTLITGVFLVKAPLIDEFKEKVQKFNFDLEYQMPFPNVYETYNKMYEYTLVPFSLNFKFNKANFDLWLDVFEMFSRPLPYETLEFYVDIDNYGCNKYLYMKIDPERPEKYVYEIISNRIE